MAEKVSSNTLTAAQLDGFTLLTGSSTPNLAVTTAVTAAMLDDAVIATDATTITLGNFANAITMKNASVATGNKLSIVQASTADTGVLNFDGRLELDGKFSVTGASGDDIMYSGASSVVGGAGADTLIGGAGNDTFYVANTNKDYVTNKTITGGTGTADKLVLTVAGVDLVAANFASVTQVEVIEFTGTTTAVFGSTPAGVTKVIGGSGVTTLTSLVANIAALNIDLATNHGTSFVAGTAVPIPNLLLVSSQKKLALS
jgi:Ca2+-binding RTX toxin-like protein